MKRSGDSEGEKRRKRRKLLQVLGDTKIPFLGPADVGFQHLWNSSYSGLVLRQACSLPAGLHGRVQAALRTLRTKGCLLRDLVRIRDRDVFTTVSRALLGQAGHTYRYLDTRLFAIPWHHEDAEAKGPACCDPDMRAACRALWELNGFFCADVPRREPRDRLDLFKAEGVRKAEPAAAAAAAAAAAEEDADAESKHSGDSKHSEGGDSESRQSEEAGGGTGESRHSDEWDLESKHSDEGCSGAGPAGPWGTRSRPGGEEEGESSQGTSAAVAGPNQCEGKSPTWTHKTGSCVASEAQEKPLADLKHSLCDYHIEDDEEEEQERQEVGEQEAEEQAEGSSCPSPTGRCAAAPPPFNVTLLNFMDPAAMKHLKEEPYYGMGKMAVGWHHDENLIARSPVAVYSYGCHGDTAGEEEAGEGASRDVSRWRIGLKVAWDIYTPGLALPLQSGDCYYMRDDLNSTHQHCVLAGDHARFSSTHRVAECSKGTLEYIQSRCTEALANLTTDPETGSHSLLSLMPLTLKHCEDIHNEVEFEWLRQYWFQGQRYTRFCSWWSGPMEQLEQDWKLMETMTMLFLSAVEDEGQAGDGRQEMAEILLAALINRQQHRQTWRDRCHSSLAQTLCPEEAPVDRPFWDRDSPSMPLPFDLADIVIRVESLLWRM